MELLTISDFKFFSSSLLVLLTEKQINTLNLKTFYRIVKFTNQIKVSTERVFIVLDISKWLDSRAVGEFSIN